VLAVQWVVFILFLSGYSALRWTPLKIGTIYWIFCMQFLLLLPVLVLSLALTSCAGCSLLAGHVLLLARCGADGDARAGTAVPLQIVRSVRFDRFPVRVGVDPIRRFRLGRCSVQWTYFPRDWQILLEAWKKNHAADVVPSKSAAVSNPATTAAAGQPHRMLPSPNGATGAGTALESEAASEANQSDRRMLEMSAL
jgi:hypothetical protein